jgi:hypothetical protein
MFSGLHPKNRIIRRMFRKPIAFQIVEIDQTARLNEGSAGKSLGTNSDAKAAASSNHFWHFVRQSGEAALPNLPWGVEHYGLFWLAVPRRRGDEPDAQTFFVEL